jgi:serine/threonine protein kinase
MPLEILQNGRYRILRQLGSGSMGEVYLVEDTRINRQVAIKVIRTESSAYSDPTTTSDAARLFEREARAIARLNHPNILPLYDFGEEVVNGAPLTYMVMPYCAEGSLATWLQQRGEDNLLSPMDVAHFLRQAADALQHAHDNGLIHQDVKPQNFLIRSNRNERLPDLLLADFGIAKLTAGTSGASQAIRGTPIYMAPEQWEGNPVPASDQYALAIMIYQLLTGRPPFQGGPGQLMYKHLSVAPQPPSTLNPILNHDVDTILLHALAKRPENRFPSVSAFGKALQEALLMDGPTILNPQDKPLADANRATLAISYAEALNGTSRTLTIAGGRHVRVDVPPGIQNGQVIRVSGQDSTIGSGGATIPLLLTIAIVPGTLHYPPAFIGNDQMATSSGAAMYTGSDRTSISNNQTVLPDGTRTSISNNPTIIPGGGSPTPVQQPYYSDAAYNNGPYFPQQDDNSNLNQRKRNTGLIILIVALVLLLIFGSAAFAFYRFSSASGTNSANATATAQANDNTVTAQNNATATAQANDTATANAQATTTGNTTATAQANANATATANANKANANATGTAIAQANANATATASASTPTPTPTPFSVKSVTMTVNPTSIAGQTCGTFVTVTYTATFVVPPNSPGGTVQFDYTANNGRSNGAASLTFAAGQTTKTYQFTWSGNLPADHSNPGTGQVITTSPNQVTSNAVKPSGQCT